MKLKSYPEYKDSGVEWIGDIPKEWNVEKLKFNSTINKESLPENKDPDYEFFYLDISNVSNNGKILNIELMRFKDAPSRARRIPNNHDTIISTVRTYLKSIAYLNGIPDNFIVSTGFSVLNPERNMFPRYLYYLVSSDLFIQTVVAHSKGIAYPAINSSDLANLPIWYPDFETQNKISSFLDKKTSEIDLTIEKDTRLIELLKEKRTALINHVVTKGLDPTVKMKDSGVEWIGEIPVDWEVRKLGFYLNLITYGFTNPMPLSDKGPYLITAEGVNHGKILYSKCRKTTREAFRLLLTNKSRPKINDILLTKDGTLGRTALVTEEDCCINQSVALLRPNSKIIPKYLKFLLESPNYQHRMKFDAKGTTIKHIQITILNKMEISVPPIQEQKQIIEYFEIKTNKIDQLIQKIQNNIELLEEYKKSLIHHVVTGKVDVREVAV